VGTSTNENVHFEHSNNSSFTNYYDKLIISKGTIITKHMELSQYFRLKRVIS